MGFRKQISIGHLDHLSYGKLSYMTNDFGELEVLKSNNHPFLMIGSLSKRLESNRNKGYEWSNKIKVINEKCFDDRYCYGNFIIDYKNKD